MPYITASLQERIKYIRMPSPVYQYVINLVVGLPIRTGWVFNDVGLLGKVGKWLQ